jgi:hypothetical protein
VDKAVWLLDTHHGSSSGMPKWWNPIHYGTYYQTGGYKPRGARQENQLASMAKNIDNLVKVMTTKAGEKAPNKLRSKEASNEKEEDEGSRVCPECLTKHRSLKLTFCRKCRAKLPPSTNPGQAEAQTPQSAPASKPYVSKTISDMGLRMGVPWDAPPLPSETARNTPGATQESPTKSDTAEPVDDDETKLLQQLASQKEKLGHLKKMPSAFKEQIDELEGSIKELQLKTGLAKSTSVERDMANLHLEIAKQSERHQKAIKKSQVALDEAEKQLLFWVTKKEQATADIAAEKARHTEVEAKLRIMEQKLKLSTIQAPVAEEAADASLFMADMVINLEKNLPDEQAKFVLAILKNYQPKGPPIKEPKIVEITEADAPRPEAPNQAQSSNAPPDESMAAKRDAEAAAGGSLATEEATNAKAARK